MLSTVRRRMANGPLPLGSPGGQAELKKALDGVIGPVGRDPRDVLRIYEEVLEPTFVAMDNPTFLAFFQGAPSQAATLFDMLVSSVALRGVTWLGASGAVAAENQVLDLLAARAGLPDTAGGCFLSGGSAANLSALVVARDTARRRLGLDDSRQVDIIVSDQAHPSVLHAIRIIGARPIVVTTPSCRLTAAGLETALRERVVAPAAVIATAGTPNAGLVDDLAAIADVASRSGIWFHVDAAYGGGAALFDPDSRAVFAGIERADSLVVDPHKWLFSPYDCSALIYRRPQSARAVHTQRAAYFDVIHDAEHLEWNPSDFAYHSTRRPRGLPLWFALAVYGTAAFEDAVRTSLRTARELAALVESTPYLESVLPPELSVVLVRRKGWSPRDYQLWSAGLLERQEGFVAPTIWAGETVARFAILNPRTSVDMLEKIVASMA
ncbi:glutamate decarboxylase [Nocardia terpenica]|uniref:Glutamate decarboxylase n=2 Tax=Nocardia terpenica TaxID=455432 RepID=A0A164ISR3_9NOCA|nr:glutamate decarboxylase [Nocardia terpenica]NQE89342.1 aminotransferase class I/II-fold pyridoxal phosphate-dependent enzyme [Nocardia terpenica]